MNDFVDLFAGEVLSGVANDQLVHPLPLFGGQSRGFADVVVGLVQVHPLHTFARLAVDLVHRHLARRVQLDQKLAQDLGLEVRVALQVPANVLNPPFDLLCFCRHFLRAAFVGFTLPWKRLPCSLSREPLAAIPIPSVFSRSAPRGDTPRTSTSVFVLVSKVGNPGLTKCKKAHARGQGKSRKGTTPFSLSTGVD